MYTFLTAHNSNLIKIQNKSNFNNLKYLIYNYKYYFI